MNDRDFPSKREGARERPRPPVGRYAAIAVAVLIGFGIFGFGVYKVVFDEKFVKQTDVAVFSRDIAKDGGAQLPLMTLVTAGKSQVRYSSICSGEGRSRYGADLETPNGVGLKATFVRMSGTREISRETLTIPAWSRVDETGQHERRNLVAQKCVELEAMAARFAAPVERSCVMATVVDTTEGMSAILVRRVSESVADSKKRLTGGTCASGGFYAYRISESPSQGDRYRVLLGPKFAAGMTEAEQGLLSLQKAEGQSSVLRGLSASLTEIARQQPVDVLRVDIYTDGLENVTDVPDRSVYEDPSLLDEPNWAKLDAAWNPTGLKLAGLEIHLHPLPGQGERAAMLSGKAFAYLKVRLEAAGATVIVEPL